MKSELKITRVKLQNIEELITPDGKIHTVTVDGYTHGHNPHYGDKLTVTFSVIARSNKSIDDTVAQTRQQITDSLNQNLPGVNDFSDQGNTAPTVETVLGSLGEALKSYETDRKYSNVENVPVSIEIKEQKHCDCELTQILRYSCKCGGK